MILTELLKLAEGKKKPKVDSVDADMDIDMDIDTSMEPVQPVVMGKKECLDCLKAMSPKDRAAVHAKLMKMVEADSAKEKITENVEDKIGIPLSQLKLTTPRMTQLLKKMEDDLDKKIENMTRPEVKAYLVNMLDADDTHVSSAMGILRDLRDVLKAAQSK